MTDEDWRYSDDRMILRQQVLNILLQKFGKDLNPDGSSKYSDQYMYECDLDWGSQGSATTFVIVKYYQAYYAS